MPSQNAPTEGFHQPLFPLGHRWDVPRRRWSQLYPEGVPPGLEYHPVRTEQVLQLAAESFPDRLALIFYRAAWTYGELLRRVRRAAANLARLGIKPGDRILFVLPNCPEFVVAWFAAHWVGAEVVPGSPLNSAAELERLANLTAPKIVIGLDARLETCVALTRCCEIPLLLVVSLARHLPAHFRVAYQLKVLLGGRPKVEPRTRVRKFTDLEEHENWPVPAPATTDPHLPAVLQPTGGTTGGSKLAILTHWNLLCNVAQGFALLGKPPGQETVLAVLPFFHIYGATAVMLGSIAGAATLLLQARFDPRRVLEVVRTYRATMGPMVPFMFAAMVEEMKQTGKRMDSLEICCSGASALDEKTRREFERLTGATIIEGYGLSEASPVVITNFPSRNEAGTVGIPVPDTEVRLVDVETGQREVAVGEVGELIARGPQIMRGYLNNPRDTASTLRDGWLYTGDLATMDERGFFKIVDRKKDMIITGGLNVFPSDVEPVIASAPGVAQCAVVGEPDEKWGERVVAYVVPVKGAKFDAQELRERCRTMLSHYKVPREFRRCDELPVSFLGKVRRVALRQAAEAPPVVPAAPLGVEAGKGADDPAPKPA